MLEQESTLEMCWSSKMGAEEEQRLDNYNSKEDVRISGDCQDTVVRTPYRCDADDDEKETESFSADVTESAVTSTRCSRRYSTLLYGKSNSKRRTAQDMTRPLKTWLYENRGNPYPTKKEKAALAVGSEMTLVQVSNWFANARRRLKNTVRQPGLTWSKRIKLYNIRASDNAERLSVASPVSDDPDDLTKDDTEGPVLRHLHSTSAAVEFPGGKIHDSPITPSALADEDTSYGQFRPPTPVCSSETASLHKCNQSILHRYLNDSIQYQGNELRPQTHRLAKDRTPPSVRCNESGSPSSHDYADVFCSPNSIESGGSQSAFRDACTLDLCDEYRQSHFRLGPARSAIEGEGLIRQTSDAEETLWKEITAALVLTNMALAKRQQRLLYKEI